VYLMWGQLWSTSTANACTQGYWNIAWHTSIMAIVLSQVDLKNPGIIEVMSGQRDNHASLHLQPCHLQYPMS
jgi:hypothetical protein